MLLFLLAVGLGLLWSSSYFANFGVGVGKGHGPSGDAAIVEITTVTDGLLMVLGGSRTDNICYDGSTGFSYGPSQALYGLEIDKIGGPHVLLPSVKHPAAWCGPYIFVPLWMPIALCLFLGAGLVLWPRRPAGTCERCWYPLEGLASGAPCPECGKPRSS
jgi:hypothetical protein